MHKRARSQDDGIEVVRGAHDDALDIASLSIEVSPAHLSRFYLVVVASGDKSR